MQLLSRLAFTVILCYPFHAPAMEKLRTHTSEANRLLEAHIDSGDLEKITRLITLETIDINCRDDKGDTPLIRACKRGDSLIVTALLKHPHIKLDIQNSHGKTALMIACELGQKKIVALLLSKSPNLNIEDLDGKTAYMLAKSHALANPDNKQHQKIIPMLRSASFLSIVTNPTVLILSAAAITALITHGSDYFNQRSFTYQDPLYHLFYFNALTNLQRKNHEALLLHTPNPVSLLHNIPFMKTLVLDQKIELMQVIRRYYQQKNVVGEPVQAALNFSRLRAFKGAQEKALEAFKLPSKEFEKAVLAAFALQPLIKQKTDFNTEGSLLIPPVKCTQVFAINQDDITDFCSTLQHKKCAASLKRKLILVWDLDTGACVAIVQLPTTKKISRLMFDPSGTHLAAISQFGEIFIISVASQEIVSSWVYPHSSSLSSLCFNKQGNRLAIGTSQGEVAVWDIHEKKIVPAQKIFRGSRVTHLFFENDKTIMVTNQQAVIRYTMPSPGIESPDLESVDLKLSASGDDSTINTLLSNDQRSAWYAIEENHLIFCEDKLQKPQTLTLDPQPIVANINGLGTHLTYISSQGISIWNISARRSVCTFNPRLPHLRSIDCGANPGDILISFHDENRKLISIFDIELPVIEPLKNRPEEELPLVEQKESDGAISKIPEQPHWLTLFQTLGKDVHERLSEEDNPQQWGSLLTGDLLNPYDLLKNEDFNTLFAKMNMTEKPNFLRILAEFAQEEHYNKPLRSCIDKDQKDTYSGRSLLEMVIDSPENLQNHLYAEQLTPDQRQKVEALFEQIEQDRTELSAFALAFQLSIERL